MGKKREYYVYILASKPYGVLYIGVTSDLIKRVYEHKNNVVAGFTQKYYIHSLVWYQQTDSVEAAIQKEKQIKKWNREWKIKLINSFNPSWEDLYEGII